jgi:6-hydroxy-3-succinoylpyridine 3-monooxygenase
VGKSSVVYVDGFNLYYGLLKDSGHKWLNLEKYFTLLRPDDHIQEIKYFTALVSGPSRSKQLLYLQALGTTSSVRIIMGKFKGKNVECRVRKCAYPGNRFFPDMVEKRTDVNIAISLLDDAYQDLCERFVLISGDSDLVPAIVRLKQRFPKKEVIVYIPTRDPTRGAAVEIRSVADKDRMLPPNLLPKCQFPSELIGNGDIRIVKPPEW